MNEIIIHTNDGMLLRVFGEASLMPPADVLSACAEAHKGKRKIDPHAALVRNALACETRPQASVRCKSQVVIEHDRKEAAFA